MFTFSKSQPHSQISTYKNALKSTNFKSELPHYKDLTRNVFLTMLVKVKSVNGQCYDWSSYDGRLSNISIVCSDKKEARANVAVLAAASPLIRNIFSDKVSFVKKKSFGLW